MNWIPSHETKPEGDALGEHLTDSSLVLRTFSPKEPGYTWSDANPPEITRCVDTGPGAPLHSSAFPHPYQAALLINYITCLRGPVHTMDLYTAIIPEEARR